MTRIRVRWVACGLAILAALSSEQLLVAQFGVGTWVKQVGRAGTPAMTMIVEACCNGGRRLIYRVVGVPGDLTVDSPFDGTDVPVLVGGKPSGETMGIERVDDHHTVTVLKMGGKPFGTSKAELSVDGKTLTVENEYTSAVGGQPVGKQTEVWIRK